MKARFFLSVCILLLSLTAVTSGQRTLQSSEILEIFEKLTSQSRTTWIPAGTIEAKHREHREPKTTDLTTIRNEVTKQVREYKSNPDKVEKTDELQKMKLDAIPFNVRYKLSNAYTMDSTVVVKYDGDRFWWETNVDSRQDSVLPESALVGNFMTDQFDLNFNRKRVNVWDGDEYITYTVSGQCATVDAAGRLPRAVNGPLTAGLVPWGYGSFTYESLSSAAVSATERSLDGKSQIQVSIVWQDGSSASLILDPAKDYAVTTCTIPAGKDTVSTNEYGDYRLVAGCWVPSTILMERRDATTNKVLGSDLWTFTSIDGTMPRPDSFSVKYELNTFVQYIPDLVTKPTTYVYSNSMDTDQLLADRLAYMAADGREPQNCATAAVSYVASRLGRDVPRDALASLVEPSGQTTLYSMKHLMESLHLYCTAVRIDLASLQNLGPVKAILHMPARNHFVVLDSTDDRTVQIVDLSENKFCYSDDADSFKQQWSGGLALLVSSTPIAGTYRHVDDTSLNTVVGGAGYSCTALLQTTCYFLCQLSCEGVFIYYWERWGCEPSQSGTCSSRPLIRYQDCDCIAGTTSNCTWGDWYYCYMLACD